MGKFSEDKMGNTRVYIGVGDMPVMVHEEFEALCKKEYGGTRWMAIKSLMDFRNARADLFHVFQELEQIKEDIINLQGNITKVKDAEAVEEFEGSLTLGASGVPYTRKE